MTHSSDAYKDAGVDIDAGNDFVERIKPLIKQTRRSGVMSDLGMFGGFFAIDTDKYKKPVLISGCDGVGTKIILAEEMGVYNSIGIDLVAMCVNDVLVHGAEPLFFLDYLACGSLEAVDLLSVVEGVAEGCVQSGAALLGGETAEMPGVYDGGKFDVSGFAVGVAERDRIVDGSGVGVGSAIIGIASSGLHSNGFSLARKIVTDNNLDIQSTPDGFEQSLGLSLLTPTRIYVKSVLHALESVNVLSAAHITGGGLIENLPRMLPRTARAVVDFDTWSKAPIFSYLQQLGNLPDHEMLRVFNCGVGFVLIVSEREAQQTIEVLEDHGERAWQIGTVESKTEDESALVVRRGGETMF